MKNREIKEIRLEEYLLSNSTYLTGRDEGRDIRKNLKLDELDNNLND